jgi:hypothetical protein
VCIAFLVRTSQLPQRSSFEVNICVDDRPPTSAAECKPTLCSHTLHEQRHGTFDVIRKITAPTSAHGLFPLGDQANIKAHFALKKGIRGLSLRSKTADPNSCLRNVRCLRSVVCLRGGQNYDDVAIEEYGNNGNEDEDKERGGEGRRWFAHISESRATGDFGGDVGSDNDSADNGKLMTMLPGGGLVSWGIGIHGRLGSGDWIDRFQPCRAFDQLNGDIVQISAGDYHSLLLSRNGSVLAFGSNGRCQLGDGTKLHRSHAEMVADLNEGFVKVSAGGLHSLALHSEGFVLVWGDNSTGQVGQSVCPFDDDAYIRHRGWPIQVANLGIPLGIPRLLLKHLVDIPT